MNYLSVFLGCGIGGVARYALTKVASEHIFTAIPPGTLAVNLIGSFLIGFFFALFNDSLAPPAAKMIVTTGFMGGFTTFSTFALETVALFQKGEVRAGVTNLLAHNLLGVVAVICGLMAYAAIRALDKGGMHA